MKENFINILREATESRTVYEPSNTINDTTSHTSKQPDTNYHYHNKGQNNTSTFKEPQFTAEPINVITPTPSTNAPSKEINQIIETPPTNISNCQSLLLVWQGLFPTLFGEMGQLSDFNPENLCNKKFNTNFEVLSQKETARLMREIYLRTLRALDTYSLTLKIGSQNAKPSLVNLRTQMQVISAAALNVYQDYTAYNVVPLRVSINSCIPKNFKDALNYLYCEIYYIFYLLNKLIFTLKTDTNFYPQLITILNNIKYQLSVTLNLYQNSNN